MWSQEVIEQHITNQIQENLNLDYKAAGALSKSDREIKEISKDVAAMANSQGGVIIYGIREFEGEKRYLPEKIDPIDQTIFTKEWLEQIINGNIRPRIQGVTIHPIQIDTDPSHCVYVIEIPQSNTAHQAKDYRYYKRFNFLSTPMEDYEIRDVMNRASIPNVSIRFELYDGVHMIDDGNSRLFRGLRIIITNEGFQIVNRFKVQIKLTAVGWYDDEQDEPKTPELVEINNKDDEFLKTWFSGNLDNSVDCHVIYQPQVGLFPQEEIEIGEKLRWGYAEDAATMDMEDWREFARDRDREINWKLFADNMPFKEGIEKVCDLPTMHFRP